MSAANEIQKLLGAALEQLQVEGTLPAGQNQAIDLERPAKPEHGDLSTNIPLVLAKKASLVPRQLAEKIVRCLPASSLFEKAEIAGPGFINFFLGPGWLTSVLTDIADQKESYGTSTEGEGVWVQVEFVSANPTGPLHVGSGRNAAYGDAVSRLLEAVGYKVHREYYINDAGKQMDRFAASLQARYLQALGLDGQVPEDGYHGEYLIELGKELAEEKSNELKDEQKEIKKWGIKKIVASHRATLMRFGIQFDEWFSEQSLHSAGKVDAVIDRLARDGHLYEKDGATWFRASALGSPRDQVIVRSDDKSSPTYLGVDMAYLIDKKQRGFDKVIYVWGADHHGNVAGLAAGAQALSVTDSIEVLLHQMVNFKSGGESSRMSRRAGTIVTLDDLLDQVGADSAKFTFLSRSIDMTIDFDLELAKKKSAENPVFYVQYQHARACSILAQGPKSDESGEGAWQPEHESEMALVKQLSEFPALVSEAARLRSPHRVTHYAQSLATAFSVFYRDCRVLTDDKNETAGRLRLVDASRQVLSNALGLLGVGAPEHM